LINPRPVLGKKRCQKLSVFPKKPSFEALEEIRRDELEVALYFFGSPSQKFQRGVLVIEIESAGSIGVVTVIKISTIDSLGTIIRCESDAGSKIIPRQD